MARRPKSIVGNKHALKLKTADARQKAYRALCDWVAQGRAQSAFHFKIDNIKITDETVINMLEIFPLEFDLSHKKYAEAQGYAHWEKKVCDAAEGINKGANTAALQMIMRNKYGWDKLNPNDRERIDTSGLKALSEFFREVSRRPSTPTPSNDPPTPSKAPASTASEPISPGLSLVKTSHVG